jgi:hypothetical protein
MKCLSNLDRINYPSDLVMDLTKLYRFKGKDFYYEDVLKANLNGMINKTVEKDTFYASKLLNLDIKETRIKLLLRKDSQPKNKDEQIFVNLKNIFKLIQEKGDDIELTTNEFLHLAFRIYKDVKKVDYTSVIKRERVNLLEENKRYSKREDFEKELNLYNRLLRSEKVETTQLITNLYIDILNLNIYNTSNEFLCLLVLYCLLFRERFNVFKYVSFFQLYYDKIDEFKTATAASKYNWEEGFATTDSLNRLIIRIMLDGYQMVEGEVSGLSWDKKMKKIDNVESSILRLPEIFTREQVRQLHPTISDSTLNRALENLKRQNKIRPNGTGRSATWVRLVEDEFINTSTKQMSLFELIMDINEDN